MTAKKRLLIRILTVIGCISSYLYFPSRLAAQMAGAMNAPQASAENAGSIPTVNLTGVHGEKSTVTAADIATLPRVTVTVFNAHTQVRQTYSGVLLSNLLTKVHAPFGKDLHGKALSIYLTATGSDQYVAVYSLAEIDPSFHPGSVLIADTMDGQVLAAEQGPLQLINTEDKRPARWVRNLVAIHLYATE